jgi:hypothetical protein
MPESPRGSRRRLHACHALMYSHARVRMPGGGRAASTRARLAACVHTLCFACACACVYAARLQAGCV